MNLRRLATIVLATSLPLLGLVAVEGPVQAHQASVTGAVVRRRLPASVPSAITPNVDNGAVWSVAQVGNTMVMGGNFTSIGGVAHAQHRRHQRHDWCGGHDVPGLDQRPGLLGPARSNDHTVYVGGSFTQVNGQPTQFLTLLDTGTGQIVSTFHTPAFDYGMIRDMAKVGNRLFIGGFFGHAGGFTHGGIAALNATTGAVDNAYMNVQFAGHHNDTGGGAAGLDRPVGAGRLARRHPPDRHRQLQDRRRAPARPAGDDRPERVVRRGGPELGDRPLRAATASTGHSTATSAESASRRTARTSWSTRPVAATRARCATRPRASRPHSTGTNIQPTWVDETGGDTVWGVTVTDDAVYIGGHNRWNNNPLGADHALPGAVPRPGLAALDPIEWTPLQLEPGPQPAGCCRVRAPGHPDRAVDGLRRRLHRQLPSTSGRRSPSSRTPADTTWRRRRRSAARHASTWAELASNGPTNVLYRVDAGGPADRLRSTAARPGPRTTPQPEPVPQPAEQPPATPGRPA